MRTSVGVTGPQRLVVRLIGRFRSISPGDLANVLHVHPSSLTGVLKRLEAARLISRTRDSADGRRAVLTLTRRGRALNDRRSGTVESAVHRTLSALPATQKRAARAALAALARELGVE
jgi:DNA-binding MarR family transcriptional regulator